MITWPSNQLDSRPRRWPPTCRRTRPSPRRPPRTTWRTKSTTRPHFCNPGPVGRLARRPLRRESPARLPAVLLLPDAGEPDGGDVNVDGRFVLAVFTRFRMMSRVFFNSLSTVATCTFPPCLSPSSWEASKKARTATTAARRSQSLAFISSDANCADIFRTDFPFVSG